MLTRKLVRDTATFLFACVVGLFFGWLYCFCGMQDVKCDNITMMCPHDAPEAADGELTVNP